LGKNCGIKYGAIGNIMGNMLGTSLETYENIMRTWWEQKSPKVFLSPLCP